MRFIIVHKTNPHWEAGAVPSALLIARVGALLGELQKANVLQSGEGLRDLAALVYPVPTVRPTGGARGRGPAATNPRRSG